MVLRLAAIHRQLGDVACGAGRFSDVVWLHRFGILAHPLRGHLTGNQFPKQGNQLSGLLRTLLQRIPPLRASQPRAPSTPATQAFLTTPPRATAPSGPPYSGPRAPPTSSGPLKDSATRAPRSSPCRKTARNGHTSVKYETLAQKPVQIPT